MCPQVQCPNCHSTDIIEYDEYLECLDCGLEFFKEFTDSEIDEENFLCKKEFNFLFFKSIYY